MMAMRRAKPDTGAAPSPAGPSCSEVVVLSGKGGTGKTTVAAALIARAAAHGVRVLATDCDVDAANLHLLLHPETVSSEPFIGGDVAAVDTSSCTGCDACSDHCAFGAMAPDHQVSALSCEGCGVCVIVCPAGAVQLVPKENGTVYRCETAYGPMVHARLHPGQGNSGKLVAEVRRSGRELARRRGATLIISDGPPGLGCPVLSAVTGADLALVVTEPSASAHHDLLRTLAVCAHFAVPAVVAVNKADIYPGGVRLIESDCRERGVEVIGRMPFSREVAESTAQARPLEGKGPAAEAMGELWRRVHGILCGPVPPGPRGAAH
ncbi:MAG: ATP-binding protein [Bacillota bacterium]|nr:ATP-binding protein [Bacillota bacterium]